MDYTDICDNLASPRTVEANMAYNLHQTGRDRFTLRDILYQVDTEPSDHTLYRQNASTLYNFVFIWLIVATSVDDESSTPLFYLVKCIDQGWIRVTPEFAESQFYI